MREIKCQFCGTRTKCLPKPNESKPCSKCGRVNFMQQAFVLAPTGNLIKI